MGIRDEAGKWKRVRRGRKWLPIVVVRRGDEVMQDGDRWGSGVTTLGWGRPWPLRVAGIHSPVPRECSLFSLLPTALSSSTLSNQPSSSGKCVLTELAPHWASSTKYHERITWDKMKP